MSIQSSLQRAGRTHANKAPWPLLPPWPPRQLARRLAASHQSVGRSVLASIESAMSVEITIRVPDELGRLEQFRDRLPEVLERGLRDLQTESGSDLEDENAIV